MNKTIYDYLDSKLDQKPNVILKSHKPKRIQVIHSKSKNPDEVFEFSKIYKSFGANYPLFCVPSSYSSVKESELIENGFKGVIYANQLIRAAYPAMEKAASQILQYKRAHEAEDNLMSINDILNLIPGTK